MATKIYTIEALARTRLEELTPRFWSSSELTQIIIAGIKDLWREGVNIKSELFLTYDNTNVSLAASSSSLTGVPTDVHKVYLIEPRDTTSAGSNQDLIFLPRNINSQDFRAARSRTAIDPVNDTVFYAITGAGAPVGAPTIRVAPQVNSAVNLLFVYIPTISSTLASSSDVPFPGECDNALVAWTVAYARAKERDDRAPDPAWLNIYIAERSRLMSSLGERQLQEPEYVPAIFEPFWS